MITKDALNILSITQDYTPEIIKRAYQKACSIYHPDRNPAGLEMMKLVNEAYETLKDATGCVADDDISAYGEEIFAALSAIIHLDLEIEVCGAWVWVGGDTKAHRDTIKAAGFKWASVKKLWHFRPAGYKSRSRGKFSMDDIRASHGSSVVSQRPAQRIQAN